ncbi:MAG: TonB-dependent receptor [Proteobacteria bacterium]|nr:TonB-dependent receptor [Pseudomonadota bacterium]
MKASTIRCCLLAPGLGLLALPALGADPVLAPVDVSAGAAPLAGPDSGRGYSQSSVSAEGVATLGGPAQTSPYRALDLMPSVNLSSQDAYGLTVDQNFLRIRGISAYTFSNLALTVDGVPSSINVGNGGMGNLFDLENVAGVSLIRGPLPADKGLGFGDLAGAMDLSLKAPQERTGVSVHAAAGSEQFHKLFARVDSGSFGAGTRFFLSASDAAADKWRGPGDQDRKNATLGFAQALGRDASFELYAVHNSFNRDDYRPLSYAQSRDLGTWNGLDYNPRLTGIAAQDALYYRFNRQEFTEDNIFAKFNWRLGADTVLKLSPYWLKTNGFRLTASGSNVMRMDIEQEQSGLVAEVATRLAALDLTAGWWTQRIATIPPPLAQKVYTINGSGQLVFSRWGILADMGKRDYDSPYFKLAGGSGPLKFAAGVRYLHFSVPGITTYSAGSIGDVGRDAALALNPAVNAGLSTTKSDYSAVLPSASLQWAFSPALEGRLAYGRGVGNPWLGPLYSTYASNAARFQSAGVSLQSLWSNLRLETADTVDAGLSWHSGALTLAPTLYVSRAKDKQVTAYDPAVGLSYLQPGVRSHAYGAELEASWAANNRLDLIGSLSWNINRLDDDIRSGAGSTLASSGKQVPDAPRLLAKLAADYHSGAWRLSPQLRHVGKRYGDALNTEAVRSYTLADLNAGYTLAATGGRPALEIGLSALNLFDRQYIASINAGQDDARPGATTYYPGAPRTVVLSLSGRF